jgi:hypothetical protein
MILGEGTLDFQLLHCNLHVGRLQPNLFRTDCGIRDCDTVWACRRILAEELDAFLFGIEVNRVRCG